MLPFGALIGGSCSKASGVAAPLFFSFQDAKSTPTRWSVNARTDVLLDVTSNLKTPSLAHALGRPLLSLYRRKEIHGIPGQIVRRLLFRLIFL